VTDRTLFGAASGRQFVKTALRDLGNPLRTAKGIIDSDTLFVVIEPGQRAA
jgi:hypothetical protein